MSQSSSANPPPDGVTVQSGLDGQQIKLPGILLSRREIIHGTAMGSLLPVLLMLGMGGFHAWGSGSWMDLIPAVLIAAVFPFIILPFFGLGWLRARGSNITVHIDPLRFVRYEYMQPELTQVVPIAAIQAVHTPADGYPRVVLELDWSGEGIQCPPLARKKPLILRFQTRAQAAWLADSIRSACTIAERGTGTEVPASLQHLLQSAEDVPPEEHEADADADRAHTRRQQTTREPSR